MEKLGKAQKLTNGATLPASWRSISHMNQKMNYRSIQIESEAEMKTNENGQKKVASSFLPQKN